MDEYIKDTKPKLLRIAQKAIRLHRYFCRMSKEYMSGYSLWFYCTRFPRAYFRFMYISMKDEE